MNIMMRVIKELVVAVVVLMVLMLEVRFMVQQNLPMEKVEPLLLVVLVVPLHIPMVLLELH